MNNITLEQKNTQIEVHKELDLKLVLFIVITHLLILAFVFWIPILDWYVRGFEVFILSVISFLLLKNVRLQIKPSLDPQVFKKPSFYFLLLCSLVLWYFLAALYFHRPFDLKSTWGLMTAPYYLIPELILYKVILYSIGTVILRPFVEEIVYRVILQSYLQMKMKKWLALLIAAIFFGIWHFDYPLFATFGGLMMGFFYMKYNSIYPSFIFHMLWNLYALFYFNYI